MESGGYEDSKGKKLTEADLIFGGVVFNKRFN